MAFRRRFYVTLAFLKIYGWIAFRWVVGYLCAYVLGYDMLHQCLLIGWNLFQFALAVVVLEDGILHAGRKESVGGWNSIIRPLS